MQLLSQVGEVFVPQHVYQQLRVDIVEDEAEPVVELQLHDLEHGLLLLHLLLLRGNAIELHH